MSWLSILGNVASGGVLGLVGQVAVGWLEVYRADKESSRKIAEMRALAEIKTEEAAWNAFAASQKASEPPSNVPPWCAAVLTLFRPFLTLFFMLLAWYAYAHATPAVQAETITEIHACAFGLAWWWCGARYQMRARAR